MDSVCKAGFLSFGLALLSGSAVLAKAPNPFVRETITCAEMREHPTEIFSREIDLGTGSGSPTEVDYNCEEALGNRPFLRRLSKLSIAIRGVQRWPCEGTQVYAKMRYQAFAELKAGFAPSLFLRQAEQAEAAAEAGQTEDNKLRYFIEWSLKSRSNSRLFRMFLSERAKALPKLTEYYKRKFRFSEAKARAVAQHALRLFSDWAYGDIASRKLIEAPPQLVQLSTDTESTAADLQAALAATPSPGQEVLDQALKAALLYRKPRPYLELLVDGLQTLNTGDESAVFFALDDPENVEFLLERGADANYANDFGKTPLFYAIELRQRRLIKLLLDHGADVNHAYKSGAEIQLPFLAGPTEASAARLKANPCAYDILSPKRTPLMHAAQHGNVGILELLIREGARLEDVDERGNNALNYARPVNAAFLRSLGLLPHQVAVEAAPQLIPWEQIEAGLARLADGDGKAAVASFETARSTDNSGLAELLIDLTKAYVADNSRVSPQGAISSEKDEDLLEIASEHFHQRYIPTAVLGDALTRIRHLLEQAPAKGPASLFLRPLLCNVRLLSGDHATDGEPVLGASGKSVDTDSLIPLQPEFTPSPHFIQAAKRSRTADTLVFDFELVVDSEGCPVSEKLLKPRPNALTAQALKSVEWWAYEPMRYEGIAMRGKVFFRYTVRFVIAPGMP